MLRQTPKTFASQISADRHLTRKYLEAVHMPEMNRLGPLSIEHKHHVLIHGFQAALRAWAPMTAPSIERRRLYPGVLGSAHDSAREATRAPSERVILLHNRSSAGRDRP